MSQMSQFIYRVSTLLEIYLSIFLHHKDLFCVSPLRFPDGRLRPYSLGLGRRIKQKLWERLDRPMFTETVDEDGLVHVDVSYGAGVQPPLYHVDVSGEPEPEYPPAKRAKH